MTFDVTTNLYFCVDAGGTRSRARVLDVQGKSQAQAASGPCNPATMFDQAVESIRDLWRQCAASLGRREDETGDIVFALGLSATIPVALAAWTPAGISMLMGAALLLHLEDG